MFVINRCIKMSMKYIKDFNFNIILRDEQRKCHSAATKYVSPSKCGPEATEGDTSCARA